MDFPGVFSITNYGEVNPTFLNGEELKTDGLERVIPHKAVITVADRSFRLQYACGHNPALAEEIQVSE